jgi:ABC-type transport system involved in cytochrome bd biosynthesis fused ATPase/permease subunit
VLEQQEKANHPSRLSQDQPWTLLAVSNDPVLAAQCDRLIFMDDGQVVADGNWKSLQKTPLFDQVFRSKEFQLHA